MKHNVIFYIDTDGEPLAYFPNDKWDFSGNNTCYSHIGQHSACHPDYVNELQKADKELYGPLRLELENQGYQLNIIN